MEDLAEATGGRQWRTRAGAGAGSVPAGWLCALEQVAVPLPETGSPGWNGGNGACWEGRSGGKQRGEPWSTLSSAVHRLERPVLQDLPEELVKGGPWNLIVG